jgi:hypothetical protein
VQSQEEVPGGFIGRSWTTAYRAHWDWLGWPAQYFVRQRSACRRIPAGETLKAVSSEEELRAMQALIGSRLKEFGQPATSAADTPAAGPSHAPGPTMPTSQPASG